MTTTARTVLVVVISLVWAVTSTASIFVEGYIANPQVQAVFMIVVGLLLSGYRKGHDKDSTPPPLDREKEEATKLTAKDSAEKRTGGLIGKVSGEPEPDGKDDP